MRISVVLMAALLGAPACAAPSAAELGWMAGSWVENRPDGRLTEEVWMQPRGGMLLGMSRSGKWDRIGLFEFMRIAEGVDGRLSLQAQPGGGPPAEFPLVQATVQSATFENPAHDHPTRIRYWRDGAKLMAEIEGKDGAGRMRWSYSPAE